MDPSAYVRGSHDTYALVLDRVTQALRNSQCLKQGDALLREANTHTHLDASPLSNQECILQKWDKALTFDQLSHKGNSITRFASRRALGYRNGRANLGVIRRLVDSSLKKNTKRPKLSHDPPETKLRQSDQSAEEEVATLSGSTLQSVESLRKSSIYHGQMVSLDDVKTVVNLIHEQQLGRVHSKKLQVLLYDALKLETATASALVAVADEMLKEHTSHPNASLCIQSVILPKLKALDSAPGRELLSLIQRGATKHHGAMVEGLLIPLLVEQKTASQWEIQIAKKLLLDYLNRSHVSKALELMFSHSKESASGSSWGSQWTEGTISLVVAAVNKRVPLASRVLNNIAANLLDAMSDGNPNAKTLRSSVSTANLAFALSSRYAKDLTCVELDHLEKALSLNSSKMAKPALAAVRKLKARLKQ